MLAHQDSRAISLARIALSVALLTVCAWVTVPIGVIPVTLQNFAIALAVCALKPKESIAAVGCYLLLGLVGVPVFSSMRGGIGVLLGPTGGFLWGYLIGTIAACLTMYVVKKAHNTGVVACAVKCAIQLILCYACGVIQFMFVMNAGLLAALAACVAPFVLIDTAKIVVAIICAQAVLKALSAVHARKASN